MTRCEHEQVREVPLSFNVFLEDGEVQILFMLVLILCLLALTSRLLISFIFWRFVCFEIDKSVGSYHSLKNVFFFQ